MKNLIIMGKVITTETLGMFLEQCKKVFALKSDVPTNNELNSRLYQYAKTTDMNSTITSELRPYAKTTDVNSTIANELRPYAKTTNVNSTIANELKPYAKTADLDVYAKKSDITKAVHYRGSVETFDDLPKSGVLVGDMYNVVKADTMHNIKAGDNVCYNGNEWDNMGGTVDLSDYATKSDVEKVVMDSIKVATESDIKSLFNGGM